MTHIIEFRNDRGEGGWSLRHSAGETDAAACPAHQLVRDFARGILALQPDLTGRFEVTVNDLGDRLLLGDRLDQAASVATGHGDCRPSERAGTEQTCDRCRRTFVVTPWADFYCAAEGDHCCESCLLAGRDLIVIDPRNN